jgi:hypothetical protein
VGEQGASRAYLEGRLAGPVADRTTPRSRLEWYGVWSAVAGVAAVLTVGLAFSSTHRQLWFPSYLTVFALNPLLAVYLRPWSRTRREPRRSGRIAAGACAAMMVCWVLFVVINDIVWHATGDLLFAVLASSGFVVVFAFIIVAYRARFAPWRRLRATSDERVDSGRA